MLSKLWESTKESRLQESIASINVKKKYTEAESADVFIVRSLSPGRWPKQYIDRTRSLVNEFHRGNLILFPSMFNWRIQIW